MYFVALGVHENHTHYAGFVEKVLSYGQKNSFVVHTSGTFSVHDHIRDHAEGTLTVE